MNRAQPLTPWQRDTALKTLRVGNTATHAAELIQARPADVYAAARTDTDLLLALAGHDPYAGTSQRRLDQADYIRLMALGLTPTEAARVLFHGDERVKDWRQTDPGFARVADDARLLNAPASRRRREHTFTPERVKVFLDGIRAGLSVVRASEEAGVTNAVIYQRRRRDAHFREAMDAARAERERLHRASPAAVGEGQWEAFREHLRTGMTMRRAAQEAGINPQTVYERRRADLHFRAVTDRWRGKAGVPHTASEEQWAAFLERLRTGVTMNRAAREAGIDPQAVYERRRTDPDFRAVTERWRAKAGAA